MSRKYTAAINALRQSKIELRSEFKDSTDPRDGEEFRLCAESIEYAIALLEAAQA